VYRKGTLHSNVDAISRPVLTVSIFNNNKIDDHDDNKNIEAYDDSYLMYYLKFKTHLPGASKRQLKRIMRLVTKYKLDLGSNTLYYRKNENVEYVKMALYCFIVNKFIKLTYIMYYFVVIIS